MSVFYILSGFCFAGNAIESIAHKFDTSTNTSIAYHLSQLIMPLAAFRCSRFSLRMQAEIEAVCTQNRAAPRTHLQALTEAFPSSANTSEIDQGNAVQWSRYPSSFGSGQDLSRCITASSSSSRPAMTVTTLLEDALPPPSQPPCCPSICCCSCVASPARSFFTSTAACKATNMQH